MRDNCTTMLVGKGASLDGSTIIARDEDYDQAYNEKRFVYYPAKKYDELFVSKGTGVEIPLSQTASGKTPCFTWSCPLSKVLRKAFSV